MKVVMTGAAGGVGTMTRPHLVGAFDQMIVSDRREITELHDGETFVQADLTDMAAMERLLEGADGLIHLGGQPVEADWEAVHSANIIGLYNTYEAARRQGCTRIVFATTNHVVGYYRRQQTIDHTAMPRPDSRYGVSKAYGEALGRFYADKYGLRVFNIRIGNFDVKPVDRRRLSIWVSPRDLVQLIRIGLEHPDIKFEIFYGASDNAAAWWDNSNARKFGYKPTGKAEDFRAQAMEAQQALPPDPVGERYQGGPFCSDEYDADQRG